jgi:hypothetical protein
MTATVLPPNVVEKLKPEYVSPIVAWLVSEQCNVSGKVFVAGGGYFSRTAFVEGPGVFFDAEKGITPEMVVEKLDQIVSLEGGSEYGSATEQTTHALSHMKFD